MVGFSRQSPQTHREARCGVGAGGGGGSGELCWHTPPLGDSVLCHEVPVQSG